MDILDLLALLLFFAAGWFWLDSLKAREAAISAAKAACDSEDLLFLDDTVAIQGFRPMRDSEGVLRVHRIYGFEYSDTGNNRCSASIVMLGS
jgi:hypothetical protein